MTRYILYLNDRLENITATLLDKLTHGVQICREVNRCRVNSLEVLTFALTEQLLPPFRYEVQGRLVVHENLSAFAFTVQSIPYSGILVCFVLSNIRIAVFLGSVSSTLHHLFDVDSSSSDRQQAYSRQHGVTSAYVVRNNERFVAFFIRQLL
ncbi:hypothetical protein D1872_260160 [compost metagenome]